MLKVAPRLFDVCLSSKRRAMYYIGPDIHKKNTQACVKDEAGRVIVSERFPSSVMAMNAFLNGLGEADANVAMEATGFYEYIYEAIEARGLSVILAHPLKLRALTAGRAKNDRATRRCSPSFSGSMSFRQRTCRQRRSESFAS